MTDPWDHGEPHRFRLSEAPSDEALNYAEDAGIPEDTIRDGAGFAADSFGEGQIVITTLTWADSNELNDIRNDAAAARETFAIAYTLEEAPWIEPDDEVEDIVEILNKAPSQVKEWLSAEFAVATSRGNGQ